MATELPETILQFGTGRFLRAFADLFVQQANDAGQAVGRVVVVQSTPGNRAEGLNSQRRSYHVAVRGLQDGQTIDRTEEVNSISRALIASTDWPQVLEFASSPALRFIISNTTEVGYALYPGDKPDDAPPKSFPAKLTQVLWHRFRRGQPPVTLLPCELIEGNATRLRELVRGQAKQWSLPDDFISWLSESCVWLNNLVDRIVVGPSADHPLAATDPMLLTTEPYALWAIERPSTRGDGERRAKSQETRAKRRKPRDEGIQVARCGSRLLALGSWLSPLPLENPAIEIVDDLSPYYLRKVRILNGTHTALVGKFMSQGFTTVQQALRDPAVKDWVLALIYEEIVPTIAYRVDNIARFVRQTLDRFQNPFFEHRLSDIALHHQSKKQIRLQTTCDEYEKLFGRRPRRILEALAWDPPGPPVS